jgi:hypothetical protein
LKYTLENVSDGTPYNLLPNTPVKSYNDVTRTFEYEGLDNSQALVVKLAFVATNPHGVRGYDEFILDMEPRCEIETIQASIIDSTPDIVRGISYTAGNT